MIFELYLQGKSILGIIRELEQQQIKSPTGKDKWCKRSIDEMLSNEKYIGIVRLFDSEQPGVQYVSEENHLPIIKKETYQAVQLEKKRRSNVVKGESGNKRKSKKYSSKQ